MNILFIIKVKTLVLIKCSYRFSQSHMLGKKIYFTMQEEDILEYTSAKCYLSRL